MYLTTVKELGTALLTKGTAFALAQTATQTNNSSVNDVLDSAQEVTASTADEVNRFVQYFNDNIPNLIASVLAIFSSSSLSSAGAALAVRRTREAASSIKSIALSGKNLSLI